MLHKLFVVAWIKPNIGCPQKDNETPFHLINTNNLIK